MPYKYAHYYVAGLIALTFWAFWPDYLADTSAVLWQHHAHGATAGFWLALLVGQSYAIHNGKRDLHKTLGKSIFMMAPLFLAGLLLVIGIKASMGEWRDFIGAQLLALDLIAIATYCYLVYGALAYRRNVGLHAGYLLATPFLLTGPIFSRILPQVFPALEPAMDDGPFRIALSLHIATLAAALMALAIYAKNRGHGRPFLVVAIALAIQPPAYATIGNTAWWADFNSLFGELSMLTLALIGALLGAAAVFAGWRAGSTASR